MKRLSLIMLFSLFVSVLWAQTLTSYSCDFESPSENAQWVLNEVAATRDITLCRNKWYIGQAGGFGVGASASSGLYISSGTADDTLECSYTSSQSVFMTASRTLNLAAGTYTAVFDWETMGGGASDGVYVFWVDNASTLTYGNWSDRTSLALPPYVTNTTVYQNASNWKSSAFTFTSSGGTGKLVILWLNSLTTAVQPAGRVDNILIYQGSPCPSPTAVRYDGNTNTISWNGNAAGYDVMLYNYNTQTLNTYTGITTNSMTMPSLSEEGYYYIYVRSTCGDGHSPWVYTEKFVWIKGARCIDIFDIGPANGNYAGKCYVGYFDDFIRNNQQGTPGMVDNGSSDPASMHTIHIDRNEIDPVAKEYGGNLHTVPAGEIASVRLGANTSSGQSARIEYKYTVTPGMSDLLDLKFAVVMNSGGHGSSLADVDMNPTFTLNILDSHGRQLDACVQRYFVAGYGDRRNWHQDASGNWFWSDWQTVTVSLVEYVGQTITIRLTSARCSYDTHPAYAYFTMNCRGGNLQGIACGDFSTDHFEAPEGFNYRWYRADDPAKTVLGTDRVFNIDRDDPTIYLVDVIDRNSAGCYYVLEANPNPRFPQAIAGVAQQRTENCQNIVDFSQASRVVRINRQTRDSSFVDEPVESVIWNFGDGSAPVMSLDSAISHVYPAEGGEYDVTVTATMSNGICEDTHLIHISLPDLTSPDTRDTTHICGEGINRIDTIVRTNTHGCEYMELHHYYYHSTFDTLYEERMCEGGRYFFPGNRRYYTHSVDTALNLKTIYGCDSIIRLKLIVDPKLIVEYPSEARVCLEDSYFEIPYQVVSGAMDSIHVYFSERDCERGFLPVYAFANGEDIRINIPDNLYPDNYQIRLEFGGERCFMEPQSATLMMLYKTNILYWNDGFISIQNADYNGGNFEFVAYEWYRNGVRLETNQSYVPTTVDDIDAVFELRLMRRNENYYIESCPLVYNPYTAVEEVYAGGLPLYPTYVERGGSITVAAGDGFSIYSVLGTRVARYEASDSERTFTAPAHNGVYIVVFDSKQSTQIIVH